MEDELNIIKIETLSEARKVAEYADNWIPAFSKEVRDYEELKKKYSKMMPRVASIIVNTNHLATANEYLFNTSTYTNKMLKVMYKNPYGEQVPTEVPVREMDNLA